MHSRLPAQPSGVCSGIWVLKPLGWSSVGLLAASFSRPLLGSCLFAQGHAFCMKNLDFPASKVSFFMVKASIFLDPNGTSDLCFLFFLGRWPATSSQGLLSRNVVFVCMHTFKTLELFFQRLSHVAALRAAKVPQSSCSSEFTQKSCSVSPARRALQTCNHPTDIKGQSLVDRCCPAEVEPRHHTF